MQRRPTQHPAKPHGAGFAHERRRGHRMTSPAPTHVDGPPPFQKTVSGVCEKQTGGQPWPKENPPIVLPGLAVIGCHLQRQRTAVDDSELGWTCMDAPQTVLKTASLASTHVQRRQLRLDRSLAHSIAVHLRPQLSVILAVILAVKRLSKPRDSYNRRLRPQSSR